MEDLSEIVSSCACVTVSRLHCVNRYSLGLTLNRLLRKKIIVHSLDPLISNCIRKNARPVLEDNPAFHIGIPLLKTNALLSVATADIYEDWCIGRCIAAKLDTEVEYIKPGWKRRELHFHEAVEYACIFGATVHPFVEIGACVVALFE